MIETENKEGFIVFGNSDGGPSRFFSVKDEALREAQRLIDMDMFHERSVYVVPGTEVRARQ